ncbi:hypothetical protein JCM17960_34080 [Magnetospira thiophila]
MKIVGPGGVLQYMNPAGLAMIESDELSKVLGKSVYPIIDREHRKAFTDLTERVLNGETGNLDFRIVGLKGTPRWLSTHAVPLLDANGRVEALLGLTRDITQQKETQARIEEVLAELKRSNEELEQFAYVSSHDLREPLRMITSYLQLLQRSHGQNLDQEAHEYIAFAVDGARRMEQLILDLLSYSRINSQKSAAQPIDCQLIIERVRENLRASISEKSATLQVGPLPTVVGDGAQFLSLFQNLIGNALKYAAPDRPPEITITAEPQGDEWLFRIDDNGIGIEPTYYQRIFVIFQRLHNREQFEGTGIGLTICKKIVENHGSRIWVESEPGVGSRFFFTLPAAS